MKKRFTVLCIISTLLLSGCNGENTAETTTSASAAATTAIVTDAPETTTEIVKEIENSSETTEQEETSEPYICSSAKETEDGWLYYLWDYNGEIKAHISGYTGTDTELVIPDKIEEYPVVNIGGYSCMSNETVTSVVFPETIEVIESNAFSYCEKLESVTIPEAVKKVSSTSFTMTPWYEKQCAENDILIIGNVLVRAANISGDYTIPDNITYISDWAFDECKEITSVTIPENVTEIGAGAFSQCYELKTVSIPTTITNLDYALFAFCYKLNNVIIPDSVTHIDADVFSGCYELTDITIPETVTFIGSEAFENTPWLAEKQAENPLVVVNGILIDGKTASGDVVITENADRIGEYAFSLNENITSVTIPDSVIEIGADAFYHCPNLRSVTMADSVEYIRSSAFSDCPELESITFSKNIKDFGYGVFYDCPKLTGFTIPDELDINIFFGAFGTYDEEYSIEAKYKGKTWIYNYDNYGFENTVQSAER